MTGAVLHDELDGTGPTRRDRRTIRTRRSIINAARDLIDEHGYHRTTVDQIADRADIAPRTFFRYFPSKEAVLFAHFDEHRRAMIGHITRRPTDEHPFRSVVEGLAEFCAVVADDRERFGWAFRIIHAQDLATEQTLLKAQTCDRIAEIIAARLGTDADDPRPQAWATIAMTLFGRAMHQALSPGRDLDPAACFRSLLADTAAAFAGTVADPHP
jgi:TetR/AcrR family transcriptional regulator, regulator of mycofactocin system